MKRRSPAGNGASSNTSETQSTPGVRRICPLDFHLCQSSPVDDMAPLKGLQGPGDAVGKHPRPTGKLGGSIECCDREGRS